jgi:hypothetical protein
MINSSDSSLIDEKSFILSLIGYGKGDGKKTKSKLSDGTPSTLTRGTTFVVLDIYIEIGKDAEKIRISKDYLEYDALMAGNLDPKSGKFEIEIEETTSIFLSPTIHKKDTLWGSIKLSLEVKENILEDIKFFTKVGSFTGIGTGSLEGVRLKGTDEFWKQIDCQESPYGYAVNYARIGTIENWPSNITSWPPITS